jgi:hypothetical protein
VIPLHDLQDCTVSSGSLCIGSFSPLLLPIRYPHQINSRSLDVWNIFSSLLNIPKLVIYNHLNYGRFSAEIDSGSTKVSVFDVLCLDRWSGIMAPLSLHSS